MSDEKPKIYIFANTAYGDGDVGGIAMAEDGHVLAGHLSSHETWLRHDMGITSDWKHDKYREHYPNGYELVWVPRAEVKAHAGIAAAYKLNQALSPPEAQ